jgi:hypothetical protein
MERKYDSIGEGRLGYGIIAVVLRLGTRDIRMREIGDRGTWISQMDMDVSRARVREDEIRVV